MCIFEHLSGSGVWSSHECGGMNPIKESVVRGKVDRVYYFLQEAQMILEGQAKRKSLGPVHGRGTQQSNRLGQGRIFGPQAGRVLISG